MPDELRHNVVWRTVKEGTMKRLKRDEEIETEKGRERETDRPRGRQIERQTDRKISKVYSRLVKSIMSLVRYICYVNIYS